MEEEDGIFDPSGDFHRLIWELHSGHGVKYWFCGGMFVKPDRWLGHLIDDLDL